MLGVRRRRLRSLKLSQTIHGTDVVHEGQQGKDSVLTLLLAAPPAETNLALSNTSSIADLLVGILGTSVFSSRVTATQLLREELHQNNRESNTDLGLLSSLPALPTTGSSLPWLSLKSVIYQKGAQKGTSGPSG